MVLVDSRRGSGELVEALAKKVPAKAEMLLAGDFAWEGYTANGRGMIGIERKKITNDLITCMVDGRFAGYQLVEMMDYFQHSYLLVEGMYRANKHTGALEFYNRGNWMAATRGREVIMYEWVQHHLNTLAMKTPVKVIRSTTPDETVEIVRDLYTWHTKKTWEQHNSHMALYDKPIPGQRVEFRRPTLRREVACKLPRVGWERSRAVELFFPNTLDMVNAGPDQWEQIGGIGKGIAEQIYRKIREE